MQVAGLGAQNFLEVRLVVDAVEFRQFEVVLDDILFNAKEDILLGFGNSEGRQYMRQSARNYIVVAGVSRSTRQCGSHLYRLGRPRTK